MNDDKIIQAVLEGLHSKHGKSSARILSSSGSRSEVIEVIPTGILPLDWHVLGCGGLPVGRIIELFSEEGGGKSSLVYQCIAQCQAVGGVAILIETESALQSERLKTFGANIDKLILIEPDYMEQALDQLSAVFTSLPKNAGPILIAWDSLAATPTKAELEAGLIGGNAIADKARIMSRACRTLLQHVSGKRAALLIVNQTRTKMGVMFGDNTTTPGGQAIKFAASIRLRISGGKAFKDDNGSHIGKDVTITGWKNRLHVPFEKCRVRLVYADGFDNEWATIDFGKDRGLIKPRSRGKKAFDAVLKETGWKQKE